MIDSQNQPQTTALLAVGWRPMDSAPRDGSSFLMSYHYRHGASYVTVASAPPHFSDRYSWWRTQSGCVPLVETHPADTRHECYATGWQPLPEPIEVEDDD